MDVRIASVEQINVYQATRRLTPSLSKFFWIALSLFVLLPLWAQDQSFARKISRVSEIGMVVSDMDRSVEFYSRVLTFEKISETEVSGDDYEHLEGLFGLRMRVVRMRLGGETVVLTQFLTPVGRPIPPESHSNDRWFQHVAIITSDMDQAYKSLRQNGVRYISTGPQVLPVHITNAAGIRAFYFRDPDNHVLEVLQFPADKGDAKWHKSNPRLFLGIDHTAIVVADTEASLKFYRDALGLRVAGESENYGAEQEHLNNVFGARLHITSLRAPEGPGIELLEYLTPRDGRPMPADSQSDDLWAWQTTLAVLDLHGQLQALRIGKYPLVSPDIVRIPNSALGLEEEFLARDPDGHLIRFTAPLHDS